jgi:hypothetical protein
MTPAEFVAKWQGSTRAERAAAQEHFIDLCRMLGQPTPNDADPTGEWYAFEKGAGKLRVARASPMSGCATTSPWGGG